MKELLNILPQSGKVEWIGLRPQKRGNVQSVCSVTISTGEGLAGDHYRGTSGKRQITLIQAEHIQSVAAILGKAVSPDLLRRNIVVSGINLLALKDKSFSLGPDVVLAFTGLCHPCSRMETNLGPGGYNTMRGHGGITARVISGGTIQVGDAVTYHSHIDTKTKK